jgi:fructokinase
LACGPAIQARWSLPSEQLPADHPAWPLEARYLALALVNFICTLSPKRIILGGGVMSHAPLFPMIRREVVALLNNYVQARAILDDIDHYIVPPGLGPRSGVLGALALAQQVAASA